jgi:hypothetical protein
MYSNYPFQVQIEIHNEQELEERITAIKLLQREGVSFEKFQLMVTNFSNGEPGRKPNESKLLSDWKVMYDRINRGDEIAEEEIKKLFEYLQRYHTMMIRSNEEGSFASSNRGNITLDQGFQLEYIVYKTLEL